MGRSRKHTAKALIRTVPRTLGKLDLKWRGEEPIVIVMVDGGLCSAITKFVLGECFKKYTGLHVKYDLSWYDLNGMDCDNVNTREFSLLKLFPDLEFDVATDREVLLYKRYFHYLNPQPYVFAEAILSQPEPLYFDGYAENWKYFFAVEDQVRKQLSFKDLSLDEPNQAVLNRIQNSHVSIAVHIRRGDYVNLGMAILDDRYYVAALERVMMESGCSNPDVFLFSDDINWVREIIAPKLNPGANYEFVDINNSNDGHFDLFLISQCDHQVSSNSSFGYWGGLLNENPKKIVVIPKHWLPGGAAQTHILGSETAHDYPGFIKIDNLPDRS